MIEVLVEVASALERAGIPYAVGGSFASSAWSSPRVTHDIDVAVRIGHATIPRLISELGPDFYLDADSAEEAVSSSDQYRMFQAIHMDQSVKVDFFAVADDEYSISEIGRAIPVEVSPGVLVPHAAPENIIIQKLRWYELGNRVSDRQWNDIVQVIEVQRGRLDWDYLRKWAAHFGLTGLLKEADAEALE